MGVPSFTGDFATVFLNSNSTPAGVVPGPPASPASASLLEGNATAASGLPPGPCPSQGRFYGLFAWHELISAPWLLRHGWDPRGEVFKAKQAQYCNLAPFDAAALSSFERVHAFKKKVLAEGGWAELEGEGAASSPGDPSDEGDIRSLVALANGLNQTGPALETFLFDNVSEPSLSRMKNDVLSEITRNG